MNSFLNHTHIKYPYLYIYHSISYIIFKWYNQNTDLISIVRQSNSSWHDKSTLLTKTQKLEILIFILGFAMKRIFEKTANNTDHNCLLKWQLWKISLFLTKNPWFFPKNYKYPADLSKFANCQIIDEYFDISEIILYV